MPCFLFYIFRPKENSSPTSAGVRTHTGIHGLAHRRRVTNDSAHGQPGEGFASREGGTRDTGEAAALGRREREREREGEAIVVKSSNTRNMFFGSRIPAAPICVVAAAAAGLAALAGVTDACDYTVDAKASLRFNIETDRLYLEGGGCITPSDIYATKLANVSDTDGNTLTALEAASIPIKPITKDGENSVNETG